MDFLDFVDKYSLEDFRDIIACTGLSNVETMELMRVKKSHFYRWLNGQADVPLVRWQEYLMQLHARKLGYKSLIDLVEHMPNKT